MLSAMREGETASLPGSNRLLTTGVAIGGNITARSTCLNANCFSQTPQKVFVADSLPELLVESKQVLRPTSQNRRV